MSENLVNLFTTQFSANLEMKLQQKGSKLRSKVREGSHVGKLASPVNQVGAIAMQAPAGRFAPLGRVDADFTRRWVFPIDRELSQLIDTFDELRTIVDPKSAYVENAANAAGRAWDDEIIAQALGTAQIGVDSGGLTSETWASLSAYSIASNFGSSSASGLSVAKIIEAKRIFEHNHVDLESDPLTLVIGSKQHSDLLNQVQVVSTEFNARPVLGGDGRVTSFLGFDIVVSERLSVASNVRSVIAFAKSGLYLGIWGDLSNRVDKRIDLSSQPWQVYTKTTFGATRLEPGRVIEILVSDTTGADITP